MCWKSENKAKTELKLVEQGKGILCRNHLNPMRVLEKRATITYLLRGYGAHKIKWDPSQKIALVVANVVHCVWLVLVQMV